MAPSPGARVPDQLNREGLQQVVSLPSAPVWYCWDTGCSVRGRVFPTATLVSRALHCVPSVTGQVHVAWLERTQPLRSELQFLGACTGGWRRG